jgi:hypothetical protein
MDKHQVEAIARTTLGVVPLSSICAGFRYVSEKGYEAQGLLFASIQRERAIGVDIWGSFSRGLKETLVMRPHTDKALTERDGKRVTAWRFIPWPEGLTLVLVCDPHYIGDQWLAFVPTDELAAALRNAQGKAR